jgi:hypothetical protein
MEYQDVILPMSYREGVSSAPHAYFVYFIYCAGRVKIGRAADVGKRLSHIATGSPFQPVLILKISGSISAEKELHARFAEDRTHREWFKLSDHLRRYLSRRLSPDEKEVFRKAESGFLESILPEPPSSGPRKWTKPKKRCGHGNPLSRSCAKCTRDAALKVYDELISKFRAARPV